eukprot:753410-Hanusia_phi.AAC.7
MVDRSASDGVKQMIRCASEGAGADHPDCKTRFQLRTIPKSNKHDFQLPDIISLTLYHSSPFISYLFFFHVICFISMNLSWCIVHCSSPRHLPAALT